MRRLMWLAVLVIVSVALIGTQARLWADDYCEWTTALQFQNPLAATAYFYNAWSGLFGHFLPRYTLWLVWPSHVIVVTAGLLALSVGVLTSLFRQIRLPYAPVYAVLVTALVTVGTISQQAVYWSTASLTYTIGCLLFTGLFVLMRRGVHPVLLVLMGFCAAGISETPTVAALIGFGLWGVFTRQKQVLPVLIGVIVGLLVVYVAPGNDVRRAAILATSDYRFGLATLPFVIGRIIGTQVQFITMPPSLLVSTLLFMTMLIAPRRPVRVAWQPIAILLLMSVASVGLSYVTRDTLPARAAFVGQLAFFAAVGYAGLWANARWSRFRRTRLMLIVLTAAVGGMAGLLFVIGILLQPAPATLVLFNWNPAFIVGALVALGAVIVYVSAAQGRRRFQRLRRAWALLMSAVLVAATVGNGLFVPSAYTYAASWDVRHARLLNTPDTASVLTPLAYDWPLDELNDTDNLLAGCAVALYQR